MGRFLPLVAMILNDIKCSLMHLQGCLSFIMIFFHSGLVTKILELELWKGTVKKGGHIPGPWILYTQSQKKRTSLTSHVTQGQGQVTPGLLATDIHIQICEYDANNPGVVKWPQLVQNLVPVRVGVSQCRPSRGIYFLAEQPPHCF